MLIRRVARPMLASLFVVSGFDAVRSPAKRAEKAGPVIADVTSKLPPDIAALLPDNPETLVRVNGAIHLGAGLTLAVGKFPRLSAAVLAATLVPTTAAGHDFWNESDPAMRSMQRTQFYKNLSLLGGLLIAAVDTEGKPGLAWRGKKAAESASAAVAAAVPFAATDSKHGRPEIVDTVGERATEFGHVASERGAEFADAAKERAAVLADNAREHAAEFADVARERVPEIAEETRKRGKRLRDKVADRAPEVLESARERAAELAQTAQERGSELAQTAQERGSELAQTAQERGSELARTAQERGAELADTAQERGAETRSKLRSLR
ncbi:DoxX family protein [Gordonia jinhuaensis]|uniref:DoxX protein n=1 Tax=Gordonia jinhuaensis TaxID=1517702 RepID=A0A916TGC4_9ACTN|nr:DoxX family membrane protein [Gordonia jinhuaensis]GGB42626.1 hypothetical protein GCM10011489_32660 [Gordonia jinhuaensis]